MMRVIDMAFVKSHRHVLIQDDCCLMQSTMLQIAIDNLGAAHKALEVQYQHLEETMSIVYAEYDLLRELLRTVYPDIRGPYKDDDDLVFSDLDQHYYVNAGVPIYDHE